MAILVAQPINLISSMTTVIRPLNSQPPKPPTAIAVHLHLDSQHQSLRIFTQIHMIQTRHGPKTQVYGTFKGKPKARLHSRTQVIIAQLLHLINLILETRKVHTIDVEAAARAKLVLVRGLASTLMVVGIQAGVGMVRLGELCNQREL